MRRQHYWRLEPGKLNVLSMCRTCTSPTKSALHSKQKSSYCQVTGALRRRWQLTETLGARSLTAVCVRSIVESPIVSAPGEPEPYVSADRAASFLDMPRKTLLGLARRGKLPGHGVPGKGRKKSWRFRLSELDRWMRTEVTWISDQGRFEERKRLL